MPVVAHISRGERRFWVLEENKKFWVWVDVVGSDFRPILSWDLSICFSCVAFERAIRTTRDEYLAYVARRDGPRMGENRQPLKANRSKTAKPCAKPRAARRYRPDGTVVWAQFDRAYDATIAHTISAAAWNFFGFADLTFRPIKEPLVV